MNKIIQYGNGVPKLSHEDRIVLRNLIAVVQREKEKRTKRFESQDAEFWKDHAFNGHADRYSRPL